MNIEEVTNKGTELQDVMSYIYRGKFVYNTAAVGALLGVSNRALSHHRIRYPDNFILGVHYFKLNYYQVGNVLSDSSKALTVTKWDTPEVGCISEKFRGYNKSSNRTSGTIILTTMRGIQEHCKQVGTGYKVGELNNKLLKAQGKVIYGNIQKAMDGEVPGSLIYNMNLLAT